MPVKMKAFWDASRRIILGSLIAGFILAFITLLGASTYDFTPYDIFNFSFLSIKNNVRYMFQYFALFSLVIFCISKIVFFVDKCGKPGLKSFFLTFIQRRWWVIAIMLLFVYSIAYISFYPGVLSYDAYMQIPQAMGNEPLSNHQPFFHTFILRMCISLMNTPNQAMVFYSAIQLTFVSFGLSYMLKTVAEFSRNKWLVLVALLYYIFFPTIVLFSFIPVKDTLFSICFCIFSLRLYISIENENKTSSFLLVTLFFGANSTLFRNNGIYVYIAILLISIAFPILRRKRVIILISCVIVIYVVVSFGASRIYHIEPSPAQEKLSIPIVQLSAVYNTYELDSHERELIETYIPDAHYYNPLLSDTVKTTFNSELYGRDACTFWKTWLYFAKQHPKTYLKAMLYLNIPYWFVEAKYPDPYCEVSYIEIEPTAIDDFNLSYANMFPKIREYLSKYAHYECVFVQNRLTKFVFSLTFPFFVMFVMLSTGLIRRDFSYVYFLLFYFVLWLTNIMGPVSNIRYLLPEYYMIPLGVLLLFRRRSNSICLIDSELSIG